MPFEVSISRNYWTTLSRPTLRLSGNILYWKYCSQSGPNSKDLNLFVFFCIFYGCPFTNFILNFILEIFNFEKFSFVFSVLLISESQALRPGLGCTYRFIHAIQWFSYTNCIYLFTFNWTKKNLLSNRFSVSTYRCESGSDPTEIDFKKPDLTVEHSFFFYLNSLSFFIQCRAECTAPFTDSGQCEVLLIVD